ncbi:MAG: hypothetical protein QME79_12450 [Bacillota bacterium]|nr:hypothetical protein [Bacillota bacterium]
MESVEIRNAPTIRPEVAAVALGLLALPPGVTCLRIEEVWRGA